MENNKNFYTIEFTSGSDYRWSYRHTDGQIKTFDREDRAEKTIKDIFRVDTEVVGATIFEWTRSIKDILKNENNDYEMAKEKIGIALMNVTGAERRKKLVKHFSDILNLK
jgi:hypothetical protein